MEASSLQLQICRAVRNALGLVNIPIERSCHGKSQQSLQRLHQATIKVGGQLVHLHWFLFIFPYSSGCVGCTSNRCTNSNADLTSEAQGQKRIMSQIREAEDGMTGSHKVARTLSENNLPYPKSGEHH